MELFYKEIEMTDDEVCKIEAKLKVNNSVRYLDSAAACARSGLLELSPVTAPGIMALREAIDQACNLINGAAHLLAELRVSNDCDLDWPARDRVAERLKNAKPR